MPGVPGVCDWSRFTVCGTIFLSVDHGLAAGTKSSYSPTIICGSNVKGDAIPPHFQRKTTAQSAEAQRINLDFVANCDFFELHLCSTNCFATPLVESVDRVSSAPLLLRFSNLNRIPLLLSRLQSICCSNVNATIGPLYL